MKKSNKEIARERVRILFQEAEKAFKKDKKLADRYVNLARKVAMKVNLRIPKEYKRCFCKHCYSYLKAGENLRVRTHNDKIIYYCLECKRHMRYPIKKKKK